LRGKERDTAMEDKVKDEEKKDDAGSSANGRVNMVTDDTFVDDVLEADAPVLVDFMAQWCGPCKFMGPVFAELAPEYEGRVRFVKMDVDENPGVSSALQIQSIPTFMLFAGKTIYAAGVGAMRPNDLRDWIEEGLSRIGTAPETPPDADE
jgi:thioredoxin 1